MPKLQNGIMSYGKDVRGFFSGQVHDEIGFETACFMRFDTDGTMKTLYTGQFENGQF